MTRRDFVGLVGAVVAVPASIMWVGRGAVAWAADSLPLTSSSPAAQSIFLFFDAAEARFIEAACERLIPADESGPGALAADVPHYLDRQLASAWGSGERLYRSGPWQTGTSLPGYPMPLVPAALFRTALRAINREWQGRGGPFAERSAEAQIAYLKLLEAGGHDLDGVPSSAFFDMLLKMTVEGFFSDPVHGANRDKVAWRMSGFPGAFADYCETVDRCLDVASGRLFP